MPAKGKPPKGTTPGTRFMEAAECRRRDMNALLEKGRYDAAVYIGGYVIECFLKFAITSQQGVHKLPADHEHHNLDKLAFTAFSKDDWNDHLMSNGGFSQINDRWSPTLRYTPRAFKAAEAKELCKIIEEVHNALKVLIRLTA